MAKTTGLGVGDVQGKKTGDEIEPGDEIDKGLDETPAKDRHAEFVRKLRVSLASARSKITNGRRQMDIHQLADGASALADVLDLMLTGPARD